MLPSNEGVGNSANHTIRPRVPGGRRTSFPRAL